MIGVADLGLLGLVYFILCFQLATGFPPLCRGFGAWPQVSARQWRGVIGPAGALLLCGAAAQVWGGWGLLPGLGAAGVWAGWRLRALVAKDPQTRRGASPPFGLSALALFDLWTLGLTAGVGALLAL